MAWPGSKPPLPAGPRGPWQHASVVIVVIAVVVTLLPFFALARFSYPAADDFCLAHGFVVDHPLVALWHHYLSWSGRYFGNFLYGVYPLWFGLFEGYAYLAPILYLLSLVAALHLCATAFSVPLWHGANIMLAGGFLVTYVLCMPDTASGFYWMAGALTYQPGNILLLALLSLCIGTLKTPPGDGFGPTSSTWSKWRRYALLGVVIFAAIGCNETTMLAVFAVIHLAVIVAWWTGRFITPWLALLGLTYVCCAIVYFAPGNETRLAAFSHGGDLFYALERCWYFGTVLLRQWLYQPVLWIYLALVALSVLVLYPRQAARVPGWLILAGLIAAATIPYVFLFPAWWSMGGPAPARTLNVIYHLFLLSLSALAAMSAAYCRTRLPATAKPQTGVPCLLLIAVCLLISFVWHSNFARAVEDWRHRAKPYHDVWQTRLSILNAAKEHSFVVLPPLPKPLPETIHFADLSSDPQDWRNHCLARYLGVADIQVPNQ